MSVRGGFLLRPDILMGFLSEKTGWSRITPPLCSDGFSRDWTLACWSSVCGFYVVVFLDNGCSDVSALWISWIWQRRISCSFKPALRDNFSAVVQICAWPTRSANIFLRLESVGQRLLSKNEFTKGDQSSSSPSQSLTSVPCSLSADHFCFCFQISLTPMSLRSNCRQWLCVAPVGFQISARLAEALAPQLSQARPVSLIDRARTGCEALLADCRRHPMMNVFGVCLWQSFSFFLDPSGVFPLTHCRCRWSYYSVSVAHCVINISLTSLQIWYAFGRLCIISICWAFWHLCSRPVV